MCGECDQNNILVAQPRIESVFICFQPECWLMRTVESKRNMGDHELL